MSSDNIRMTTDLSGNRPEDSPAAMGWIAFAACMMIMVGVFHIIAGLSGIIGDTAYVATPNYVFAFDSTTWGWIHLLAGALVALAGAALFQGALWARTVGVILALVSAIGTFAFLPSSPIWAMAILAADVAVIWALTTHGRAWAVR
jgi:hypothetical protein